MSVLKIQLVKDEGFLRSVYLPAEVVIEMTLTIKPDSNWAGLPKLISIVNIIEKINDDGFELTSENEVDKIADLITNYYIPTPMNLWDDKELELEVTKIPLASAAFYTEVSYIRTQTKNTVRDVLSHDPQNQSDYVSQAQNKLRDNIQNRVRNKPAWKTKVLDLLLKAAVTSLFDCFVGFPLHTLVANVLGGIFGAHYSI